ncbi:hypothetical protein [Aliiroseovarius halocynthiae]|nr:hypothetical protein [Aliiroseovarius halocynthiae]
MLTSTSAVWAQSSEWRNIIPTNAPGCADGSDYSFWARAANPSKLAVIFPGGGACWSGGSCDQENEYSNYEANSTLEGDPTEDGGIFDLNNPQNPLSDYSFIVLPTCNGDVSLGDNTITYQTQVEDGSSKEYQVLHKGFGNAMAGIEWAQSTFPDAKDITIMGWSAGAIPSPLYTHIIAQRYENAKVSHVADGAGGYRVDDELDLAFENWGTRNVFKQVKGFESLADGKLSFEDIYVRAAQLNPDINFHQLNIAHDYTQAYFLQALGVDEPNVFARIKTAQTYINDNVSNFRTYTAGGEAENIIGGFYDGILNHSLQNNGKPYVLDRLYTYQSDGTPVLEWINSVVAHENVKNVLCENCGEPSYTVTFEDED